MTVPVRTPALSPSQRLLRMRARSWVLHVLYLWESTGTERPLLSVMEETLSRRIVSAGRVPLIRRHLGTLVEHLPEIDRAIQAAAENWRIERLSRVDRAVLRLAIAELLYMPDVPPKVAVQEGVRLAGQYGGNDSPRFVNGVLDAVLRSTRGEVG